MNRDQFYKSDKWRNFRKVIIEERTDADGYVHCAICGKPILKKYDLILHHVDELDDMNVNDATVALNPDNVQCVHFKCHNQVHERFGFHTTSSGGNFKPVQKHVYIVYGSPLSGKSTWVKENATQNDLVVDMDSLWQMISINNRYNKPNALKSVVFEMRDKMYDINLPRYQAGSDRLRHRLRCSDHHDPLLRRLQRRCFLRHPVHECLRCPAGQNRPSCEVRCTQEGGSEVI